MSSLTKSTIVVTILNALGIGFAFVSNLVIAGIFGSSVLMDVYLAATALPFFIITVISGSLNITFMPVFAEYRTNKKNDIWEVVSSIINLNILLTSVLTISIIFFAEPIMRLLTPGFSKEKIELASNLLRWQIPVIIFCVINELMASIYYSNNKFVAPLLNKVISPCISIAFVLLFSKFVDIKSIVFASLFGMFIQTLILAWGFRKDKNFDYFFVFKFKNPAVIKIYKLMIPLMASMLFYKIIPLFDRFLGSKLPDGNISYLGYSFKIYSQLPSIISTGISISIFPLIAALASKKDILSIRENMSKGIRMLFFISIPFVFMFGFYGYYIIKLLFHRGAFTLNDTLTTSQALTFYILALPMAVMGDIIGKGYYIFQDTITPALIGIIETVLYIGIAYILLPHFGFLAIPIAYAIYFNFSGINAFIVRKKLGGNGGRTIIFSFAKHFICALIAFSIIYFPLNYFQNLVLKNAFIGFSFVLYFLLSLKVLKTNESLTLWNGIASKLILFLVKPFRNKTILI